MMNLRSGVSQSSFYLVQWQDIYTQNVWRDSLQWGYPVFCVISKLLKYAVRKTAFLLVFGKQS